MIGITVTFMSPPCIFSSRQRIRSAYSKPHRQFSVSAISFDNGHWQPLKKSSNLTIREKERRKDKETEREKETHRVCVRERERYGNRDRERERWK